MKFATLSLIPSFLAALVSCRPVELVTRQDAYPGNFKPNFNSDFDVTIQQPLADVFRVLGTNEGLGAHILLSSLASDFALGTKDAVSLDGNIEDAFARTLAGTPDGALPRQAFTYVETIKVIPGLSLADIKVNLAGTFTWDETRQIALYETQTTSSSDVTVRKTRRFESVDGGAATKVSEQLVGQCNFLLKPIVQSTARKAHIEQMNGYSTLF